MAHTHKSPLEESLLAEAVTQPTEYGYYLSYNDLYYKLESCTVRYDFSYHKLRGIKHIPFQDTDIKVIAHFPDWNYQQTNFFIQGLNDLNLNNPKQTEPVSFFQKGADTYELSFTNIREGQMLFVCEYNNQYAMGIGSISDALLEMFNSGDDKTSSVFGNITMALKSFPENLQLQALKSIWEQKETDEKTAKIWEVVLQKYSDFENREDREGKLVFADDTLHEIQYYLSLDSHPAQKEEAEKLIQLLEAFKNEKVEQVKTELPDRSLLAKNAIVYKGDYFTLTTVQIGDELLLRFNGIPNHFDGVVLRHKKRIQNDFTGDYILQTNEVNGDNWNTFCCEADSWTGRSYLFVYPPLIDTKVGVQIDYSNTDDTPEKVYDDYCRQ
ncbi:hypothetical protein V6R21_23050 [Limibacter armeniacum]|uniref:hypothetical protein n=1 Tax=Limibacter armeniacum TaxID=466084 RepID=UPI002FE51565